MYHTACAEAIEDLGHTPRPVSARSLSIQGFILSTIAVIIIGMMCFDCGGEQISRGANWSETKGTGSGGDR